MLEGCKTVSDVKCPAHSSIVCGVQKGPDSEVDYVVGSAER